MNIFEQAARLRLRFPSERGDLTVEQVFDLKLPALDGLAKRANADLKSVTEESFVSTITNPMKPIYALRLEIAKFIIADKLAVAEANTQAKLVAEKRARLLEALDQKAGAELQTMSRAEIEAALASLK